MEAKGDMDMAAAPSTGHFGPYDYVVFGAMLLVSSLIGLYYRLSGGKQSTASEYLMGDRDRSELPVAFSLMASFMSAITLLGVSQENYMFGTQFVVINIAYIIGTPLAAYVYLPVFFRLQSASAYEYLEKRFGKVARLTASLAFSLQMILYMGIVLYAPAIALSAVTGLSYTGSILGVGGVCTFYSTLGGIKAVLATDVFQSLFMFAAVVAVIGAAMVKVGGITEILRRAEEGGRFEFFNLDPDLSTRHTLWTQIFGGLFIFLSIYGVNQAQVQRLLTIGELRRSQRALWLQWPILTALSFATSLAGLSIYAYYQGCDPVTQGRITKGDQLLPVFVVDTMNQYPGLSGLFVAGIFSGSLSTVSSAINSLAAVTMEDYIKPCCKTLKHPTMILKGLALFYGLFCILLTFMVEFLGTGVLQASLTVFGVVGGPLLGLFTLGMTTRRTNQAGAVTGLFVSLVFLFWIGFGQPRPRPSPLPLSTSDCTKEVANVTTPVTMKMSDVNEDDDFFYLYRISYAWFALLGFAITTLVGYVTSIVAEQFGQAQEDFDPNLLIDWLRTSDPMKEDAAEVAPPDGDKPYTELKRFETDEEQTAR